MAKIRVYELAKELNVKNKVLMDKLADMKVQIRSHMSSLEDEDVLKIREELGTASENASGTKPVVIRRPNKKRLAQQRKPVMLDETPEHHIQTETEAKTETNEDAEPDILLIQKPEIAKAETKTPDDIHSSDMSLQPELIPSKSEPTESESQTVQTDQAAHEFQTDSDASVQPVQTETEPVEPKSVYLEKQEIVTPVKTKKFYEEPARIVKPALIEDTIGIKPEETKIIEPEILDKSIQVIEPAEPAVEPSITVEPSKIEEPVQPSDSDSEPAKSEYFVKTHDYTPSESFKKSKKIEQFDKNQKHYTDKQNKPFKKFRKFKRDAPAKIIKLPTLEEKNALIKQIQPEKPESVVDVQKTPAPEMKKKEERVFTPYVKDFRKDKDRDNRDSRDRDNRDKDSRVRDNRDSRDRDNRDKDNRDRNRSKDKIKEQDRDRDRDKDRDRDIIRVFVKDTDKNKDIEGEADKRKKKWKKTTPAPVDDTERDKKFFKKKISFKRKEVIEGDQLYDEVRKDRKPKKAVKAKPLPVEKPQITVPKAIKRRIKIDETIMLSDLAKRMSIKASDMIAKLMAMGVMATVNQTIDFDTASLVATEFNYEVEKDVFEENNLLKVTKDDPSTLLHRPPVVTIMGHVDHGKTSLLDVIRKTKITENEAGGITQHIGAYQVATENGQIIFLDTPGHEAFTAIRARGAKITDLVVLVVAADDGVMPQTIEAINHSKAAGVPIIVAVNKIDKPNADIDRVYRQLSDHGLVPEDWGGDTIYVHVSAKQNIGIDNLLDMILLQSEVLELKANPDKYAVGYVVEAKLDAGRGAAATVLIQEGTLHVGDAIVCGVQFGKVRAMYNDRGIPVEIATPSIPVEVIGLSGVPNAGDELMALEDDKAARQVSIHRMQKQRAKDLAKTSRVSLEKLFEKMKEDKLKDLNLIIKADVHGSIEALRDSLTKLSNEEVRINVVHSATGTITESDVSLATVSNAIIIGFNVRPTTKAQTLAAEENVDIRYHNIIYNVIKEVQDAIVGLMESTFVERIHGRAEIREVFHVPKVGAIAGSYVVDGKIQRGRPIRLLRDGVVIYDGKISSLKRFKDDVKEVLSGYECGIGVENYNDIKIGDIIECYYMEEIKPELDANGKLPQHSSGK